VRILYGKIKTLLAYMDGVDRKVQYMSNDLPNSANQQDFGIPKNQLILQLEVCMHKLYFHFTKRYNLFLNKSNE
jgi:hypothetical protein